MLADNKIALNASWDKELLATELADLSTMDLGIDLDVTGFEVGEVDIILENHLVTEEQEAETCPVPGNSKPTITRPGDLWLLGQHRVLCGNAREQLHVFA
jgi:hypothetical protein